jgi:hypothetical protein
VVVSRLAVAKRQYRKAARSLRAGDKVATTLAKAQSAQTRETVIAALDEFERCRYVSRLSIIAAGLEDGMSITALSRAWGVSRQLVSRYVTFIRSGEGQ